MFVLIPSQQYLSKLDSILCNTTKFQQITRDPTLSIIRKVNKIIDAVNARRDGLHLQKITGDFRPGYIYGNVKTHKDDNPLHHIISQIPTPTYHLAKTLNAIFTPFVHTEYCFMSSLPLLKIEEIHLRELLRICTQEAAFRCPRGKLYQQIDGVAMSSPLDVLFANFFMGSVEKEVFNRSGRPPIVRPVRRRHLREDHQL
ncbi:uncharacterized protein LOC143039774 [Oratosquilla oratoria]|uniref:uncharacterized protein LOC143039774 n=1 Tax=Oratosquilla oratoria TaxID=337810 RepID=UPI003F7615A8